MLNTTAFPKYFIDQASVIHTVWDTSRSTLNSDFSIVGDTILLLGEVDYTEQNEKNPTSRLVEEEYTLYPSLLALALQIEYNAKLDTIPGSIQTAVLSRANDAIKDALSQFTSCYRPAGALFLADIKPGETYYLVNYYRQVSPPQVTVSMVEFSEINETNARCGKERVFTLRIDHSRELPEQNGERFFSNCALKDINLIANDYNRHFVFATFAEAEAYAVSIFS